MASSHCRDVHETVWLKTKALNLQDQDKTSSLVVTRLVEIGKSQVSRVPGLTHGDYEIIG